MYGVRCGLVSLLIANMLAHTNTHCRYYRVCLGISRTDVSSTASATHTRLRLTPIDNLKDGHASSMNNNMYIVHTYISGNRKVSVRTEPDNG